MSGARTLGLVVALAIAAVAAIIGMLLVEDALLDGLLFCVAALPLVAGAWRWYVNHAPRI